MRINSSGFRKYSGNVSWLLFEKVFSLLIGVVVGVYVARYLKPENYGLLNYAMSFVGIFAAFSTLGLNSILVRELSQHPENRDDLLGTTFVLRLIGSLILFLVLFVAVLLLETDPRTNLLIYIIATAELFKAGEVVHDYYLAKILARRMARVMMISNVILALFKLGLVYMQAPLLWFAIAILLGSALNALGFAWIYWRKEGSPLQWVFRKTLALQLMRESWPLILYGFALHVQARVDQVMLGKMLNNYEVGQYSVALKIVEMMGFVPMALINTFSPAVSRAKKEDHDKYMDRLLNLYRLLFAVFLVMALPLYFFAEEIIEILFGEDYRSAGFLLSLFAIRLFFTNMGVGKSVFIVNESLFRYSLVTAVIGAAVNILLNYLLIPHFASVGAIVASLISFTVGIFLVDLFYPAVLPNLRIMFKGIFSFWKLRQAQ